MKFKVFLREDAKYLIAYIAPLAAWAGFYLGGMWSPGSIYVGFVIIPLLELMIGGSSENFPAREEVTRSRRRFFDMLLYLNAPILYGLMVYYLLRMTGGGLSWVELTGMLFSMGLIVGTSGINVGHELGHRPGAFDRWMAWTLLLPALYLHFYIEHNRGHHRWVATHQDPATARRGESIYAFWVRSMAGSWVNAWRLESERLRNAGRSPWSLYNQMLLFQIAQVVYLGLCFWLFGLAGLLSAAGAALVGMLLLESINYIEHYGLLRKKSEEGRYEPVQPHHSWNSDHHLGRIFLYELTRHSDHHYRASRKYQILRHFDGSPQLPYGYPASILLSLVPPLWFHLMDDELHRFDQNRIIPT